MTTRPYLHFYTRDWLTAPELRVCKPVSRSLWIDLLCFAYLEEPYGYITLRGKAVTPAEIANMIAGWTIEAVVEALADLRGHGVFSEDRKGRMYSRRMVRAEKLAQVSRKNGAKGGNPSLRKQTANGDQDNPAPRARAQPRAAIANANANDSSKEEPSQEEATARANGSARAPISEALAAYAELAERCNLAKVAVFTPDRRKKLKAILDQYGIAQFRKALERVEESDFCRGLTDGRGWKADFDFIVRPSSFVKLLEGKYDNRVESTRPFGQSARSPPADQELSEAELIAEMERRHAARAQRQRG